MNELSPEVQAAIIMSASRVALEFARMKAEARKGRKSFNQLYIDAFQKNYNKLVSIIAKPEITEDALPKPAISTRKTAAPGGTS